MNEVLIVYRLFRDRRTYLLWLEENSDKSFSRSSSYFYSGSFAKKKLAKHTIKSIVEDGVLLLYRVRTPTSIIQVITEFINSTDRDYDKLVNKLRETTIYNRSIRYIHRV